MSQSILGIDLQSTHEIVGGFFKIPFFVAKRSAIEQSIDFLWINAQSMIVRFDRLRPVIFLGFIFERSGQPVIGIGPGHDAHFFANLASLKIQYKLPRKRFQTGPLSFHYNIFAVGENTQLRQRHVNLSKLFAKSGKGSPQTVGRHSPVNQLLYGAKADQIAKTVEAVSLFFSGRNKAQAVPILQLFPGQTQDALNFFWAESVRWTHQRLAGYLLSCPFLHGGNRLHRSSWRLLAHGRFRCERGHGSGCLLFRQTLLEGFHQVNHGSHMRLRYFGHFLAFELGSDHRSYILLLFVPIFLWLERSRKTFNKLSRELLFLFFHFDLIGRNRFSRAYLIGIEHRVQRHAFGSWPDNHDVFTLMHGEFCDGSVTGLFHSFHEQLISLHPGVLGSNVIGGIKVERIHLAQLHELQNLHHARRGRLDLVELFFAEQNVLILFVFVALHDFGSFHVTVANRAKQRLFEP